MYFSGNISICPVCGGDIIHPHTGELEEWQSEENFTKCHWMEVVDEGGCSLGYTAMCKNGSDKPSQESIEEDIQELTLAAKYEKRMLELTKCVQRNLSKIDNEVALELLEILGV